MRLLVFLLRLRFLRWRIFRWRIFRRGVFRWRQFRRRLDYTMRIDRIALGVDDAGAAGDALELRLGVLGGVVAIAHDGYAGNAGVRVIVSGGGGAGPVVPGTLLPTFSHGGTADRLNFTP